MTEETIEIGEKSTADYVMHNVMKRFIVEAFLKEKLKTTKQICTDIAYEILKKEGGSGSFVVSAMLIKKSDYNYNE